MQIAAVVRSTGDIHRVEVSTSGNSRPLSIPPKLSGPGSSVNGGEFLMLALATCYCNDIYREAARMGIQVTAVEVEATANFNGIGLAASNVCYRAKVDSPASAEQVARLLQETDGVAEVHNTLRRGVNVTRVP